ncbi:family 2 glycosyl transferase [Kaistia algarum]|nr:family 2 glycosyl transferase [Kaistia algarum]
MIPSAGAKTGALHRRVLGATANTESSDVGDAMPNTKRSSKMPRVSVVVRSYNESEHIGKLMRGLASQSHQDYEVVLVDSGSTDDTVAIAESHGARIVRIDKSEFSFGRALNIGCAAAEGEILVFASAHVYPLRTDWIASLIAPFESPAIALTYGRQVGNSVSKFSEHQVFDAWFPAHSVARQASYFCNNANCAIRRSAWEERRYDETLTGLEDLAWAKLAQQQGGQIAYVAEAVIAHVHDETWARVRNRYRREAIALRRIESNIRVSFRDFLGLAAANIAEDIRRARKQRVLKREWRSILLFRFNQFYGTWRGQTTHTPIDAALRNRFYYPASQAAPHAAPAESTTAAARERSIQYD